MPRPTRGYLGCYLEPLEEMPSGGLCTWARRTASDQDAHIDTYRTRTPLTHACCHSSPDLCFLIFNFFKSSFVISFFLSFLPLLIPPQFPAFFPQFYVARVCVCALVHAGRPEENGRQGPSLHPLPIRQSLIEFGANAASTSDSPSSSPMVLDLQVHRITLGLFLSVVP